MSTKNLLLVLGSAALLLMSSCCVGVMMLGIFYKPYGKRIDLNGGSQLYYTQTVTEPEARQLAQMLNDKFLSDGDPAVTFQLNKEEQTYQVRVVTKEGKESEAEFTFMTLGFLISMQVFENAPLEVHLCDKNLKTIKVLEIKKSESKT
jgi:hypothetical protein